MPPVLFPELQPGVYLPEYSTLALSGSTPCRDETDEVNQGYTFQVEVDENGLVTTYAGVDNYNGEIGGPVFCGALSTNQCSSGYGSLHKCNPGGPSPRQDPDNPGVVTSEEGVVYVKDGAFSDLNPLSDSSFKLSVEGDSTATLEFHLYEMFLPYDEDVVYTGVV